MRRRGWLSWGVLGALVGCTPSQSADTTPPSAARADRAWGHRIFHSDARELEFEAMLDALAQADYVLVGETHIDDQTHRLERAIFEGLAERKSVILSMEMFERDEQPALDAYVSGSIDEDDFLGQVSTWGNYRTGYRMLVESARARKIQVVGANLPRDLQRRFAMKGPTARDGLSEQERVWFPQKIFEPTPSYWARIERQLRDAGHGSMMKKDAKARTWSTQNLWDNSMADAMVNARHEHPDTTVVHVVGAFHAEYGDGTAAQIRHRDPQASIAIVTIDAVADLRGVQADLDPARADYTIFALADARGPNGGELEVTVPSSLRYQIATPERGEPRGLLIWLGDDETRDRDALQRWQEVLGPEFLIAVVAAPHRLRTDDLRLAGRWSWPDTASRDAARTTMGLERIVEYLGSRWSIPEGRVVVAGRGAGADVALWFALRADTPATVVADQPANPRLLAEASVPDHMTVKDITLLAESEAYETISKTFQSAGTTLQAPQGDAEASVRAGLGLEARAQRGSEVELTIDVDSTIAWQWARLHARLAERDGLPRTVRLTNGTTPTLKVEPADFRSGAGLPLAPGAFGGTTIVVLRPDVSADEQAAWKALSEPDVLKKRNRFASLKVTTDEGLGPLLDELRSKGKRSMLIVPAAFVVDAARMRTLEQLTVGHDEGLDLNWLPGLGGAAAEAMLSKSTPSKH